MNHENSDGFIKFMGLEWHGWRGFSSERDLFLKWQRFGFLTFVWGYQRPTDSIKRMKDKLDE